jgi:predicted branched-subunit amino acid permease
MEAALTKALAVLATYGPGFVVAAIFIILYLLERKKSEQSAEKLQELAVASIKADLEHTKTVDAMQRAFDGALKALVERRR